MRHRRSVRSPLVQYAEQMGSRTAHAGAPPPAGLGPLVRRHRQAASLGVRAAARRIGISRELPRRDRGVTQPDDRTRPGAVAADPRVHRARAATSTSTCCSRRRARPAVPAGHVLLYDADGAAGAPLDAARTLFAGDVDGWIDAHDAERRAPPQRRRGARPPGRDARGGRTLGSARAPRRPVRRELAHPARRGRPGGDGRERGLVARRRDGALPGGVRARSGSRRLRLPRGRPTAARAAPRSARDDGAADPAHDGVAVREADGALQVGPAASTAMLADARPEGVDAEAWRALTAAAAAGLARAVARTA